MPYELATLVPCAIHINFRGERDRSVRLYYLRPLRVRSARILDLPHKRGLGPYALEVIDDGEPHRVALVDTTRMHKQRVRKEHLTRAMRISANTM